MSEGAGQRTERDSMGELQVPAHALWGAQTQRALHNFAAHGGGPMPEPLLRALLLVKAAAARANGALGVLDAAKAQAIADAALALHADTALARHFPLDVWQTGSATSTNMNANEVLATLASRRLGAPVSANDDVNAGQSSNDCMPSAIHVAAVLALQRELLPALDQLIETTQRKGERLRDVVKTGRTHLMDAMPVRLDQVLGGWAQQLRDHRERLAALLPALRRLAQGGTAVGTGVNAHPQFAARFHAELSALTGEPFEPAPSAFAAMAMPDAAVALSGACRALAASLLKIANDLRWMNSGPLAGLGEIVLPALQPGSSIMPGKVNPVIPEAVAMMCVQVMGHDVAIGIAGASGSFELNVMLPLVARDLLESLALLAAGARSLADRAIEGFTVNEAQLERALARNPVLATALNPHVGYLRAAEIAKAAYAQGRPILDVADEMTDIGRERLRELLDPRRLTGV